MGLRFRKSIKLGCGVRINLSKSGVGYSIGGRGFRTTVSPKGRVTNTFSIPGTGLSYSTSHSSRRKSASTNHARSSSRSSNSSNGYGNEYQDRGLGESISTISADIENFQSSEYSELLSKIRKTKRIHSFSTFLMVAAIICSLFSSGYIKILLIAVGIGLKLFVHFNVAVDLDFNMDEESNERYASYCSAWAKVCGSAGKQQQISSADVINRKINSGASSSIKTQNISIDNKLPAYIKTNVEVYVLKLYKETLCLFPDKILIIKSGKIGAVNYDEVRIQYDKQRIIGAAMFRDSEKVGETWRFVNKNGTPDKRYKNNIKLNICLCGKITMTSMSGLNVILILSNNKIIDELK